VPGEALGCAVNVVRRAGIAAGERVAVVGIGFLGAVVTRLAVRAGARVAAISRRRFALDLARSLGAEQTLELGDGVREQALESTCGAGFDCVVEAAGVQRTLDLASELTRERGRLVIAGYNQDGPRRVDMQLWNWRGLDVINAHERAAAAYVDGMRGALALLSSGELEIERLVTHRFALEDLDGAFESMARRPEGFLKGIVAP
jgi:threonine dehydrogenase-like Zn-dependent dehydrogenase